MQQAARHRVHIVRMESGEHLPLVVDPDGMPVVLPNLWLMDLRSHPARAPQSQTLENYAHALALFEDFLAKRGIDAVTRHRSGVVFGEGEARGLFNGLAALSPHFAARRVKKKERLDQAVEPGVGRKPVPVPRTDVVCAELVGRRHTIVIDYLRFLADTLEDAAPGGRRRDPEASPFGTLGARLKRRVKTPVQPGRTALEDEDVKAAFRAVLPSGARMRNDANRFDPAVQHRNFVILVLLDSLGLRISELLALKLEDVDLTPEAPTLKVVRRPDDPDDRKNRKTQAKTLPRTLPLQPQVAGLLALWLDEHRTDETRFGDVGGCPFVFLALGRPAPAAASQLSRSGADKIFRSMRERDADLPSELTPHRFRHGLVTRLWLERLEGKHNFPIFDETVAYVMGWMEGSQQMRGYTKLATQKEAGKLTLGWQDHITRHLEIPHDAVPGAGDA